MTSRNNLRDKVQAIERSTLNDNEKTAAIQSLLQLGIAAGGTQHGQHASHSSSTTQAPQNLFLRWPVLYGKLLIVDLDNARVRANSIRQQVRATNKQHQIRDMALDHALDILDRGERAVKGIESALTAFSNSFRNHKGNNQPTGSQLLYSRYVDGDVLSSMQKVIDDFNIRLYRLQAPQTTKHIQQLSVYITPQVDAVTDIEGVCGKILNWVNDPFLDFKLASAILRARIALEYRETPAAEIEEARVWWEGIQETMRVMKVAEPAGCLGAGELPEHPGRFLGGNDPYGQDHHFGSTHESPPKVDKQ